MSVIMSFEISQQIPGNSDASYQTSDVVDQPVENVTTWISRNRRGLWGVGVVGAAIIIGVSIRSLFRRKN